MSLSKRQVTDRFVELMEQMYGQMRSRPVGEWQDLELTMPQVRTLVLLRQGPKRMSDIAAYLGVGLSSATSMIDRLVGKGLVERVPDPADRRVVTCRLTPRGEEQVEHFWRIGRMKIEQVASVLTLEELEIVVHAMEVLSVAISRRREAGTPDATAGAGAARRAGLADDPAERTGRGSDAAPSH
ncbi:MAG: MarR family transcriptional regulator [Chloroflexi bacterium]|nr:MarR family transcriptional regulator [Chloroflexota bacterium]